MRLSFDENTKEVCVEDGAGKVLKMQKISVALVLLSQIFLLIDLDLKNITILDYISMVLIIAILINLF